MYRQKILDQVRRIILDTRSRLSPSHVTESASLTNDLNLHETHLESLFLRLRGEVVEANFKFTPWYIHALRPGQDTVGSLVDYLIGPKSSTWRVSPPPSIRPSQSLEVTRS